MSGDLEDFLRRAAQRRQAKAAQQEQAPPRRQAPQYSSRRTERIVSVSDADEILTAEIVEDESDSVAVRMHRAEEAKHAAAQAREEAKKKRRHAESEKPKSTAVEVALSGNPAQDLISLLRQPGGIQQAILLREVLDRPEHRW